MTTLTALVLAGTRAGGDPLASGEGVSHKALITIAGRAMIEHVVHALDAVPEIGRIVIAIERPEALEDLPGLRVPGCRRPVTIVAAAEGPSASVASVLAREGVPLPAPIMARFLPHRSGKSTSTLLPPPARPKFTSRP